MTGIYDEEKKNREFRGDAALVIVCLFLLILGSSWNFLNEIHALETRLSDFEQYEQERINALWAFTYKHAPIFVCDEVNAYAPFYFTCIGGLDGQPGFCSESDRCLRGHLEIEGHIVEVAGK